MSSYLVAAPTSEARYADGQHTFLHLLHREAFSIWLLIRQHDKDFPWLLRVVAYEYDERGEFELHAREFESLRAELAGLEGEITRDPAGATETIRRFAEEEVPARGLTVDLSGLSTDAAIEGLKRIRELLDFAQSKGWRVYGEVD